MSMFKVIDEISDTQCECHNVMALSSYIGHLMEKYENLDYEIIEKGGKVIIRLCK